MDGFEVLRVLFLGICLVFYYLVAWGWPKTLARSQQAYGSPGSGEAWIRSTMKPTQMSQSPRPPRRSTIVDESAHSCRTR